MASKIQIWNMALGWVGMDVVASESEGTPAAVACTLYYDECRKQVLRDFPWSFAQTRVALAEVDVPEAYASDYAYAYAYPSNCLQARGLIYNGFEYDYMIVASADGASRTILCNLAEAVLSYTIDVTNPDLFDSLFVRALARRLAADIAKRFSKNNLQLVQEQEAYYAREIERAFVDDASERRDSYRKNAWVESRSTDFVLGDPFGGVRKARS